MLAALIAAGVGELAAPALAATATTATAAAPVVASTAAPLLMAAPAAEAVAAPLVAETVAAPVTEAVTSSAAEAMANSAAQGIASATPEAASTVGQEVANAGIEQGFNTINPTSPGTGPNINFEGTSAGARNPGIDMYNQFTQAPPPIEQAAANPSIAPPNTPTPQGIERAVDTRFPAQTAPPAEPAPRGMDVWNAKNVYDPVPGMQTTTVQTGSLLNPAASSTTPITESASSGLQKGIESALKFTKDYPLATTLGIQVAGRLMDSGSSGAPPKKPAVRKDMSGFNASSPSTVGYNPIYQPTPYAEGGLAYGIGGAVEQMSAQNAISGNMMYPQSQLQTPMYSNPMVQRPLPSNIINSGIDTPTDAYTGEQRFAEGGTTGSGSLDLHVPIDLGASGIAQGGAGGYSAAGSGGQTATLSTATGAPSQTAQPPVAMAPAATAEPLNIQPRGHTYIPKMQTISEGGGGIIPVRERYTVNDEAADAWVKEKIQEKGRQMTAGGGMWGAKKDDYQNLYNQYYQGYAKGGTTTSEPNYAQMLGAVTPEQQKANEEYLQAYNKREMANSINTDSDVDTAKQDPMHASMTRLKKIGKRVGIKPVELPKSAVTDANVFHAANGGIMHNLGGYSDGGRLLRGPGDGVSDSIPATIGNKQPARLADGEFVVPARIVSELGNGSTEAGARKLYEMMDRVQADRKKSIGKGKVAVNSKATKHLPK